jgi:hypothetical protein
MAEAPGNVSCQTYWLKTPDTYLVDQVRMYHADAVYALGEYSMFILLWGITDLQAGTVQRCPYCYDRPDATGRDAAIAEVYGQPALALCSYCYGTTFFKLSADELGGLKAKLVRPCMWTNSDEIHKREAQGEFIAATSSVQSTSDFRMRSGDYVFRADGTRWRVYPSPQISDSVITGLQAANDLNSMVGYKYDGMTRQDEGTVAYLVPPTSPFDLQTILDISLVPNWPICFEDYEVYNNGTTSLIGDDYTPGMNPNPNLQP